MRELVSVATRTIHRKEVQSPIQARRERYERV